ncbi:MAG: glycosyltransferase [Acidimicrobiales bacterium]
MTTASVIIRTKNEEKGLGPTLDAVLAQSLRPFEVFVIDSGSTDATLEVASRYPVRVLTLAPQEWNYSRALNRAAEQATGEVLVCLSAHCPPVGSDWLASLLGHFADPSVAGVWGPGLRPGRPAPEAESFCRQDPGTYTVANRRWGLANANSAVRRSLWEQFPFEEALPAAEDKAWARVAMERGYSIIYEPRAAVWHERHDVISAYRRSQAVSAGFAIMFPELRRAPLEQLALVMRSFARTARFHARNRKWRAIWYDLRRVPTAVAAIAGGFRGSRR